MPYEVLNSSENPDLGLLDIAINSQFVSKDVSLISDK